jgi:hypothetical protein
MSSLFHIGLLEVMDDCSWMYQDSSQGLQKIDYYNEVNYTIYNLRNISRGGIGCLCKRWKNKKFLDPDDGKNV